ATSSLPLSLHDALPISQHRLRAVDARGLPLDLWLHCRSIVYEGEQALQVILRPVHGQTLPQPRSRAPQHSFEEQDPHGIPTAARSEEHTSELQSRENLV